MARNRARASMREGPLAELFRATEAAQRQAEREQRGEETPAAEAPTVEHVGPDDMTIAEASALPDQRKSDPAPEPERELPPAASTAPTAAPVIEAPPPEEFPAARFADPTPRLHRAPRPESAAYLAVIRVVGVGGGGLNGVNRMIEAGISQVEFVAVNTDIQQLRGCEAPIKLHIGRELTQGLGSGADPDVGRQAAEDAYDQIKHVLRGSDMVFITAGEGGGTGTGSAPVVARIARELGALTVGIVTMPFKFEGSRRREQAEKGVEMLRSSCDTVIVIPNDRLLEVLDQSTSMLEAFRVADDVLRQGVQGICDLITTPGLINLDFADVRTIMSDAGTALMGIGFSTGENRGREAAERALRSPLIDTEIVGARGILLSIAGGQDLTLIEVNEAAETIRSAATEETNIIFGATIDERLAGQVWVTVVATGIGKGKRRAITNVAETPRSAAVAAEEPRIADDEPLEPPSFLRDL
jgi:cell division protein FtsZ